MSWDVTLFKSSDGQFRRETLQSMGSPEVVRSAISRGLPSVIWSEPDYGRGSAGSFLLSFHVGREFDLGPDKPVSHVTMAVRGSGDPMQLLSALCTANAWQAWDWTSAKTLDPANPSSEGWQSFQRFCQGALCPKKAKE